MSFRVIALLIAAGAAKSGAAPDPVPDAGRGRQVYALCAACHDPAAANRAGPSLVGIVGRKAGTAPGFRYSRAMKRSRIVWDDSSLGAYLADPQGAVPGGAMPFPGLPDERKRADLIAYLKTLR